MESKEHQRERMGGLSDGSDSTKGEKTEDDDKVAFVGRWHLPCTGEPNSGGQVLHLNTQLAKDGAGSEAGVAAASIYRRHVAPVTVVFDLPDGSQAEQEFQLGQTVELLKSYVESEFGIAMACQELYLGSTLMMDPLSLLDYPEIDGKGDVLIVVEGDMSADAKK